MKKAYNQPAIKVINLQPFSLMTGSETVPVRSGDYNSTTMTIGAKGSWDWSDDEPEEEYAKW